MKVLIVYGSTTGNTAGMAEAGTLRSIWPVLLSAAISDAVSGSLSSFSGMSSVGISDCPLPWREEHALKSSVASSAHSSKICPETFFPHKTFMDASPIPQLAFAREAA